MAGRSSLNPNAEPYVPLKRGDAEEVSKNDDDAPPLLNEHLLKSKTSSSSIQKVIKWLEANAEEDVAILKTMFPDTLEQSISDVYISNDRNVDKTIDMLKELQNSVKESSRSAPTAEGSAKESSTKT